MGTGCGGGDAAGTCTYHECAFRRALRWLFRKVRAAALWSMIRARNRLGVGTCHDSVGDGFVPCEFGVPARALMIGAYAVRPTVTARPVPRTGKRVCRPTGWEKKSAVSRSRFFSQPSREFLICWQMGTYRRGWESRRTIHGYAVSARAGATEFARHEAVPDRVMASADD